MIVQSNIMNKIYRKFEVELQPITMWSFYFLFKFYLLVKGSINFNIVENLLFLIFLSIPIPNKISRYKTVRILRVVLNIVLAIVILWRDSWLPPFFDAIIFLNQQGMPSFRYIISFLMGFYSNSLMIASLLFLIICIFVRRYQKFKVFIAALLTVLIITVPLIYDRLIQSQVQSAKLQSQSSSETPKKNPSEYLESFYNAESQRLIMFHQPDTESTPFDIVILHISSLSWDDLKEIGITQEDPFFKQFDYLFTNFNSAAISDSGAVMRLMLSNCGQKSDKEINKDELPNNMCLLIERLTSVGYTPYVSMDSNDINGDYAKIFKKIGFNKAVTITKENLTANALYLDEKSPLYSNYAILKKWFDTRKSLRSERTFLYHNSILLKQGSHWIDDKQWTSRDNRDQYKDVYSSLLKDIQQFIDLLKSSKRNTLLIIIPEYGRYLSVNSKAEDMPLPKITKVPVGIKFIGPIFNDTIVQQHIISKPASYFAISWILSKFIENSPFGETPMTSEDIVFKIPMTDFVSEQDGRVIMEMDGSYLFYGEDKKWTTLTPEQLK